jgi:uncharacterized protein
MSKVVHFEIAAEDPEKLSQFYTEVFGWKIEEWKQSGVVEENNRYWLIKAGEKAEMGAEGGMYKRQKPIAKGGSNAFVCNIAVGNIEEAVEKVRANGGKAEKIMDIPKVGKTSSAEDPDGNMFAIFQPDPNGMMMQDM